MNFQGEILAKSLAKVHFAMRLFSHLAKFFENFAKKKKICQLSRPKITPA